MKFPYRTVIAGAAALALVFTIGGCSGSNKGTGGGGSSPGPSNVDAAKVVKEAADAMRQVTGMHINVEVQGNVPNLSLTKLDGDVAKTPQAATGSATLTVGNKPVDSKFVFVDGHLYSDVAEPGGKYTDYGDGVSIYDVGTLLNPDKGLANILSNLKNPKVAGTEQVNGIATTKITGTSSSSDVARLAGRRLGPETETQEPTTVWIASDGSHHLVKLQIVPVENSTITLTMSDWGKQVTATKPPV